MAKGKKNHKKQLQKGKREARKARKKAPLAIKARPPVRWTAPGLVGFRLDVPDSLPDVDTPLRRMLSVVGMHGTSALAAIPTEEREALLYSLGATLSRAEYHEQRFGQIVSMLAERYKLLAVPVAYDTYVEYAAYDAASALGAARTAVDELLYITARRHGIPANVINDSKSGKDWPAAKVVDRPFTERPDFNVPEVHHLRNRASWYKDMNDYRNVLFHRGWRSHIGGYFDPVDTRPEALDAHQNVFLVPDSASLKGQTRPHQWTYNEHRRLEDTIQAALDGLRELLHEIAVTVWDGSIPPPGQLPKAEQANILAPVPQPQCLILDNDILVPLFTTRERAQIFPGYPSFTRLTLAELPIIEGGFREPTFAFSVQGYQPLIEPRRERQMIIQVDPHATAEGPRASVTHRAALETIALSRYERPVLFPVRFARAQRLFCWRPAPE